MRLVKAKKRGESVIIVFKAPIFGAARKLKLELTLDELLDMAGIIPIDAGEEYERVEWRKAVELTTPGEVFKLNAEWVKAVELTTPGVLGEDYTKYVPAEYFEEDAPYDFAELYGWE